MLCTVSEDGSMRLWRTGPDEEDGGKCVAMARGFDAAKEMGEVHDVQHTKHGVMQHKRVHHAGFQGWQWMGALHSVTADNDKGIIYTGSASGAICEFDLNQRSWEELEGTDDVMELVRNNYYFSKGQQYANRHTGEKTLKGSSVYSLHLADDGYLFAGSEDGSTHEFWVNTTGREHQLVSGNCIG